MGSRERAALTGPRSTPAGGAGSLCDPVACVSKTKHDRIVAAVLENMNAWISAAEEIAEHAIPTNKGRALNLERNLRQCQQALRRLAGLDQS